MTSDDKRDLYRGADDGYTRAMELALTPVVAGGLGYLIDRAIGTLPLLTIVFLMVAVVATFLKMYYTYDTTMKAHDAESPWGRAAAAKASANGGARAPGGGSST
jgi:F0F1-type ATP synthase assembly protein I